MEQEDTKTRSFTDGSDQVIGACIEVHRQLGPGLLESAYEAALCHELRLRGLRFERQRRDTGLLVNFNSPILVNGLRRLIRGKDFAFESAP